MSAALLVLDKWGGGPGERAGGVNLQLPCVSLGLDSAPINNPAPLLAGSRQVGPACGDQSWLRGRGSPFFDMRRPRLGDHLTARLRPSGKEAGGPVGSAAHACRLASGRVERPGSAPVERGLGGDRGRAHSLAGVRAPRRPGARPADFVFEDTRGPLGSCLRLTTQSPFHAYRLRPVGASEWGQMLLSCCPWSREDRMKAGFWGKAWLCGRPPGGRGKVMEVAGEAELRSRVVQALTNNRASGGGARGGRRWACWSRDQVT